MGRAEGLLPPGARRLLDAAGLPRPIAADRLEGGRNNRVFRLDFEDRAPIVLKHYFHHPDDLRDRLAAEFAFLEAAEALDMTCVPRPLAKDPAIRVALYSHLPGRRAAPPDATPEAVGAMLAFVTALQTARRRAGLPSLPTASEACFTPAEHLATVERRVARLAMPADDTALARDAAAFVRDEVAAAWAAVKTRVLTHLRGMEEAFDSPLPEDRRVLSPSDFGLHNALRMDDGRLFFLDFEYAGWDDPAKLVGDSFHQVKVPLPPSTYRAFRDGVAALSADPSREARRYDAWNPVYGLKWVTILLNEFVPTAERRRAFAAAEDVNEDQRAGQLAAARRKLAEVTTMDHPL